MKYNILTVASEQYAPFLDIFLNSFFKNGNQKDLEKLYVVDIDLGAYKQYLHPSNKIVYLNSEQEDTYTGVHSDGWYKNVSLKTQYLHQLLSSEDIQDPIILIDSDVLILQDISSLLNLSYDMQFTNMSAGSHTGASGIEITQIGCFVACNNKKKSRSFVELWIEASKQLKRLNAPKPHETPAMNIVINLLENKSANGLELTIANTIKTKYEIESMKIGYLDDRVSCSDRVIYPQSKTLHFKTNGPSSKGNSFGDFMKRIHTIESYSEVQLIDLNEYLNQDLFSLWAMDKMQINKI